MWVCPVTSKGLTYILNKVEMLFIYKIKNTVNRLFFLIILFNITE